MIQQCQFQSCDQPATWSISFPAWGSRPAGPRLACDWHKDQCESFAKATVPGLDKPARASDDWRPSIVAVIHLADMEARRQERRRGQQAPASSQIEIDRIRRYAPPQQATLARLRQLQARQ